MRFIDSIDIRLFLTSFFCIFLCTFSNNPLYAQPPNVRRGDQPGASAERFRDFMQEKQEMLEKEEKEPVQIEVEKNPARKMGDMTFVLKEVKLNGMTHVFKSDILASYYWILNKEVTLQEIENIRKAIEDEYNSKGYLTTLVYFPEQDIVDGVVTINVLEGKMGKLGIEGIKWMKEKVIRKKFSIFEGKVLNVKELESIVEEINSIPDISVKPYLSQGDEEGTVDIVLKAEEDIPYHIGWSYDNQGSRLTGRPRKMITFRHSNLTGHGDKLFGSVMLAREANAQSISYKVPLELKDMYFGVNYYHYNMRLGKEFRVFNIKGDTRVLTPYVIKKLLLFNDLEGSLKAGMAVKSIKKKTEGTTLSDDQLRLPFISMELEDRDEWGYSKVQSKISVGTGHFLGASKLDHPTSGRQGTGGFFIKYNHTIRRIQRMFMGTYAEINLEFQLATHTLKSSEQMQIGGADTVRGYPEGDFLADTGFIFNLDWFLPMSFIPEKYNIPYSEIPIKDVFEPFIFLDAGGGRLNERFLSEDRRDKFLASIGGGVKIRVLKYLFIKAMWGYPIGSKPISNTGPSTFHITVQTEI